MIGLTLTSRYADGGTWSNPAHEHTAAATGDPVPVRSAVKSVLRGGLGTIRGNVITSAVAQVR
jgi:hypothetical protein